MRDRQVAILCALVLLIFSAIALNILSPTGGFGVVQLNVKGFNVILAQPLPYDTYLISGSTFVVNTTLNLIFDNASWCGASLNKQANITMQNASSNWNTTVTVTSFGKQNISVFCNNTAGAMYSNFTEFYIQNNTAVRLSVVPLTEIPTNETISDYIITGNVNQDTYTSDCVGGENITYDDNKFVSINISNFTFSGCADANVTTIKYQKAPPNMTAISTSLTPLSYVDVKILGLSNGMADINISYNDSEVSGYDEDTLVVYKETAIKSWTLANLTTRYAADNKLQIRENVTALNLTAFAVAGEIVVTPSPIGPGGGTGGSGGGGGGAPPIKKVVFSVTPSILNLSITRGDTKSEIIGVTNEGNTTATFSISTAGMSYLFISTESFTLEGGETRNIRVDIVTTSTTPLDVYTGYISIKSGSSEQKVSIIAEVSTLKQVFDVAVEIPESYASIYVGTSPTARIKLFNFGTVTKEVQLRYGIKTMDNKILTESTDMILVETRVELLKSFDIDLEPGNYVFYTVAKYDSETAVGSAIFEVKALPTNLIIIIAAILVIGINLTAVVLYFKRKKRSKKRR